METEDFKIFRSSAGSGKTYRLAVEYLKLALKHPTYYRRILAVTFTNKATNEMKARIIEFLFDIANNEAEEKLIYTLCNELSLNNIQLKDRANKTLRTLLHGYSYFSVSTIDSFFQRVISAFSKDLGIQGGYNLEFEINQVKDEIIDKLFTDLDEKTALKKWLVQFAMSRIESNKSWDIRYDIRQLTGQIFFENFSNYYDALSEKISDTTQLSQVLKGIKGERDKIKQKFEKLGQEGLDMIRHFGLELSDFSRGMIGPAGLFYKMANNQNINVTSKYLNDALFSKEAWFTKKSNKQSIILDALRDGLLNHYEQTLTIYKKQIIKDNTYAAAQKYFYNLGILSNLIDGLKEYREENEVVLISDLSHLLRIVIGENDAPFIYEKVGSFYNHYLIDEFQDTSRFQWANFLPLVLNSMSMGQFNMIVGDVKQSIYRWRGGDWEILQNQVEMDVGHHNVNSETLSDNWRSLKNIVDFNNTLFKSLSELFKIKFIEEVNDISDPELQSVMTPYSKRFEEAYSDVMQNLPIKKNSKNDGLVEIKFIANSIDEPEALPWKDKVLPELIDRIITLQDCKYSPKDIAILVRTKDEGRKVANYLLNYKNNQEYNSKYRFDVISSESLFLKASPAVNVIIYFIRLVINQKDLIASANLYYWLSILKCRDQDIDYGNIFKTSDADSQTDLNLKLLNISGHINFTKYRSVPIVDLIEEITLLLHLFDHKEEGAYLLGLQNVILEYLTNNNNDLHAFIEWWFEEGEKKSIKPSLEQDAINILTIHQSKGLQYKNVLIPYCSWNIDHSPHNENIIWAESNLPVLDQIPYYPLRYSKQFGESYFIKDYFNEKSLAYMDNLNLLYVALTRAEEGLFVFSELPNNPARKQTVGDTLLQFFSIQHFDNEELDNSEFSNLIKFWNEEEHVFRLGQMVKEETHDHSESLYTLDNYPKGRWQEKISIRKQADIFSSSEESEVPGENINYGILLHDILSKIFRKEQLDYVLTAEEHAGNLTKEDKQRLSLMLENLWKIEKVNSWFTGGWEIKTEVPVLPEKGQLSRMDRVMIKDNKAIVVDYKTGAKRHSDINQVKDYMNILGKMGYDPVEGYVLYLINSELITV